MTKKTHKPNREWLSALHDDALEQWPVDEDFDDAALEQWRMQMGVRAALRNESLPDPAQTERLFQALHRVQHEEPVARRRTAIVGGEGLTQPVPLAVAANDARYAWSWVAAVVLGVGSWVLWVGDASNPDAMVAQRPEVAPTALIASTPLAQDVLVVEGVARDPRVDALIDRHRQWGGWSAGAAFPASYARNVALER